MKKRSLYWLCQVGGWSLLLLLDLLIKASSGFFVTEQVIAVLFLYFSGLFISHYLRGFYHERLKNKSLGKTVLLVMGYSFLAANAVLAICLPILITVKALIIEISLPTSLQLYISNSVWMSIIFLIWSALYISITRQREYSELNQAQAAMLMNLNEAQLVTLQQQLNPHFMFNCINNIRALILEKPAKARDMLTHMAEMLRYNLDPNRKSSISIREEVRVAEDYMALCSIQFEDRLIYICDVAESALDMKIPKMTVQLLLENAVKHGINDAIDGGTVKLTIENDNQLIKIHVENTGELNESQTDTSTGIGINNIEERLRIAYGDAAGIKLMQVGSMVRATIELPCEVNQ